MLVHRRYVPYRAGHITSFIADASSLRTHAALHGTNGVEPEQAQHVLLQLLGPSEQLVPWAGGKGTPLAVGVALHGLVFYRCVQHGPAYVCMNYMPHDGCVNQAGNAEAHLGTLKQALVAKGPNMHQCSC